MRANKWWVVAFGWFVIIVTANGMSILYRDSRNDTDMESDHMLTDDIPIFKFVLTAGASAALVLVLAVVICIVYRKMRWKPGRKPPAKEEKEEAEEAAESNDLMQDDFHDV